MPEFSMQAVEDVRDWLERSAGHNPGPHPAPQYIEVSGWRFGMKEAQMGGQRVRIAYCRELGMIICPADTDLFQAAK